MSNVTMDGRATCAGVIRKILEELNPKERPDTKTIYEATLARISQMPPEDRPTKQLRRDDIYAAWQVWNNGRNGAKPKRVAGRLHLIGIVVEEVRRQGLTASTGDILAAVRKTLDAMPENQRPLAHLSRNHVDKARSVVKGYRRDYRVERQKRIPQGSEAQRIEPKGIETTLSAEAYSVGELMAAKSLLATCGGDYTKATKALQMMVKLKEM